MCARFALALTSLLLILCFITPTVPAQPPTPTEIWQYQAIENVLAFAILPDVDGDAVPDVVVEAYDAGAVGDHLTLLSGGATGTPAVIWSARPSSGASDGGGYGQQCLVVCDDLDGDGFPDVLLGTAWGNRSVHALNGLTGDVLWTFDTYSEPESGWVYAVRALPDRTGDGRPEVVFGTGANGNRGYLLDGSTGAIIWRFFGAVGAIGHTEVLPDMNGDGIADVLFCGWDSEQRVFCVSGAGSGAATQIWSRNTGVTNYTAVVIDDVTHDGLPEIVVGTWQASNQVICIDGSDGSTVWTFDNGSFNYIMRLEVIDDIDGDGYRDIAVGSWSRALSVISGKTGDLLWSSLAGTLNGGYFWSVARVDDIDGDGISEVVGGSFDQNIYLFSGATGDTLWTFPTGNRVYVVAGAPDLSGGGTPDVLGGTQRLTTGGRVFALEGGDQVTTVPDLPYASGRALRHDAAVTLSWQVSEPWPCVVDRLVTVDEKSADDAMRELAMAHERGEMTVREVLEAVHAGAGVGKAAGGVTRLTDTPLLPAEPGDDGWSFALTDPEVPAGQVRYRISVVLPDGGERMVLELAPAVGGTPGPLVLAATAAPNPFNPRTEVRLSLDRAAEVAIDVHDLQGRRVGRLGPVAAAAGENVVPWDGAGFGGRALPAGVYMLRVLAEGESWVVKAVLVR
jgi:outer membrane protein assembly factor BamB